MIPGEIGALVTGGASGLGEAAARMIAASGGRVAILDLPAGSGEHLAEELGEGVAYFAVDVREEAQVAAAVAGAITHCGRLDLCVNCAGVNPGGRLLDEDGSIRPLDRLRLALAVNLVGLVDVVRHAAAAMAANRPGADGERGLIVNVASIAAFEGQSGQSAYAASKGGVAALTIQLARELATHGIRVVAIAPGMMETPMFDGMPTEVRTRLTESHLFPKRLGTAGEFARLLACVVETPSLNGETIRLDAGARLV